MSASVYYQPVHGTLLNVGGGKSSFLQLLGRIVGSSDGPWELDGQLVARLEGAAATTSNADHRAAIEELLDAIHKHGTIRVWAEY